MSEANFQYLIWSMGRADQDCWYEMVFMQEFTDPTQMDFSDLLACGIPGNLMPAELTQAEKDDLTSIGKEFALQYDVDRIPRETVETMLCTCFDLTPEMVEQLDLTSLENAPYFQETDCFYGLSNSYDGHSPNIKEAYWMEDGTTVIYFTRDPMNTLCRAVLKQEPQVRGAAYKVLENTVANL